jgi:hypothetical protein
MIKTFENCSPEYQITIICFFIFLTLLYMILVIYEGTGKRQRKMLLQDSASSPVGDIVWRHLSQTQLWQKPYAGRANVNLS